MSREAFLDDTFEIEPTRGRSWNLHVPWWLLAAVAFAVVELTAHPALGVMIFCLRFGFNDWRTARWLCRTDPYPHRANTIWWFLVGSGFLKIFVMSVLVFPLICMVCAVCGFPPDEHEVGASILIGVGGIFVSLIVTHVGAILAARRSVKVWINRQIHVSRDRNEWPPAIRGPNHLKTIIDASSLPAIMGFVLGLVILIIGVFGKVLAAAMIGSLIVAVSTIILMSHAVLLKRIVANAPDECWLTWRPATKMSPPRKADTITTLTEDDLIDD